VTCKEKLEKLKEKGMSDIYTLGGRRTQRGEGGDFRFSEAIKERKGEILMGGKEKSSLHSSGEERKLPD